MSYSKRSSQRRSFTPLAGEMPMSAFRKDLFDEIGKGSYIGGGEKALSLRSGGGSRKRSVSFFLSLVLFSSMSHEILS